MSDKKDLSISNLSKERYRELKYFCRQFYEWKDTLRKTDFTLEVNKQVGKSLKKKIDMVITSAKEASPILYDFLIQSVAQDIPFRYLNIPCRERQFYDLRRRFFSILDKKLN